MARTVALGGIAVLVIAAAGAAGYLIGREEAPDEAAAFAAREQASDEAAEATATS